MSGSTVRVPDRGKPADYGQEIVKRRFRRTMKMVKFSGKVVLDFGCGNGSQTNEFLSSGCAAIAAVDIDFRDLKVFSSYLRINNFTSVVPIQYDGMHLPIATSSIDVVLSYEVLEHVYNESEALRELHRVLKPGGEMILSVPNKGWIFETHGARLPLLPWNRVPFFSWLPRPIHSRLAKARIYRKRDIVNLLEAHAFRIRFVEYITAPMDVVRNLRLKEFLRSKVFTGDTTTRSILSTSILVHCTKV